jgi:hypothetical protein
MSPPPRPLPPDLSDADEFTGLLFHQTVIPDSCTKRGSLWRASCTIDGTGYHADSRSGAAYALARVLVAAGIEDQPVRVTSDFRDGTKIVRLKGHLDYRSLHRMAGRIVSEGNQPIRVIPYVAPDEALRPSERTVRERKGLEA